MIGLHGLSASQASARIKAGDITAEQLVRACLERIADRDPTVRAWTYVDPASVLREARELDKGGYRGPLHGIPIGVKDMIDTADMPTTHNSPIFQGHRPGQDAAAVATLRAAGAIILGKTDTTEFAAAGRQAWTRNPHDTTRTPGVVGLRIALCRSPAWPEAEAGTPEALEHTAAALRRAGAVVTMLDLPAEFEPLGDMQRVVMHAEGRAAFLSLARCHPHLLHDEFVWRVENRDGITRAQLTAAYDHAARCRTSFDAIASEYDAVLTPSAKGEAPLGRHPGDAVFNRMWTLLHVPCVNIPANRGSNGMPVGVTLTAPRFHDRRLLAVAATVESALA